MRQPTLISSDTNQSEKAISSKVALLFIIISLMIGTLWYVSTPFSLFGMANLTSHLSLVLLIFSLCYYLIGFSYEHTVVPLVLQWVLGHTTLTTWARPKNMDSIVVRESEHEWPLPSVDVLVRQGNNPIFHVSTDAYGRAFLPSTLTRDVSLRFAKQGYHAISLGKDELTSNVTLTALTPNFSSGLFYQVIHSLRHVYLSFLVLGTFLLVPSLFIHEPELITLMLLGYLVLWVMELHSNMRRVHITKVVNEITGLPVVYAHIILHRGKQSLRVMTDWQGRAKIPYPLPQKISVMKRGYKSLRHVTIPITAITAEELILSLTPSED